MTPCATCDARDCPTCGDPPPLENTGARIPPSPEECAALAEYQEACAIDRLGSTRETRATKKRLNAIHLDYGRKRKRGQDT